MTVLHQFFIHGKTVRTSTFIKLLCQVLVCVNVHMYASSFPPAEIYERKERGGLAFISPMMLQCEDFLLRVQSTHTHTHRFDASDVWTAIADPLKIWDTRQTRVSKCRETKM